MFFFLKKVPLQNMQNYTKLYVKLIEYTHFCLVYLVIKVNKRFFVILRFDVIKKHIYKPMSICRVYSSRRFICVSSS